MTENPVFDARFQEELAELMRWRRDVRRFRADPVPEALLAALFDLAQISPSVGNSQPWRIIRVQSADKRGEIRRNFLDCNAEALAAQSDDRAALYARLKLAGLDAAPVQLAVFCDHATEQGHGLGTRTMPEMLDYSVVCMISGLWLAARAAGLGLGWVSILDPARVAAALNAPASYKLIAFLCIGWPEEEHVDPELVRSGWQARTDAGQKIVTV
ncbi:5,6-dimethylbenzimidazole synthase [Rhodoblastus acidophilus]|uniref:5,6-dimethylbenzimidazole synthase n=1 Tax=Candidatus Rhodoblastus alkanivorans TaxID=2954117 RepID=A0ABS9ZAK0_9HYPH|nr:5,6-dimethylbenzimidazole synthase [Candidatus Rhodoblastus alkanivorans]MCI4679297.1 5,6-dimethylbenzimidazole synthase [Candidatus Rhodoblastus alkanivorans]MCI4684076.1 5,6-dimethylbenzimidazole synthase [Candidatus Rhodoblastus alkanivorans]MDI4641396.1 5,6-dimethylbenzimidazole synthase [Rhodoblastus acidophilus]